MTAGRGSKAALAVTLFFELALPLLVFYGLRALGVDQITALLVAAVLPAARIAHGAIRERRLNGVSVFVLVTLVLTVALTYVTGSPRALLVRSAWASAAMGLWILATLLTRRPFLFSVTRVFLTTRDQRVWDGNWEGSAVFRRALRVSTAVWGTVFLACTGLSVTMALTLPIDLVPLLDDLLLVLTLGLILLFQRFYGRAQLGRHGLRMRGVHLERIEGPADPTGTSTPTVPSQL